MSRSDIAAGSLENVSEAARRLGIFRQSLQRRLRKHAPTH
jgi:ActR/RegA family two-component response regulator